MVIQQPSIEDDEGGRLMREEADEGNKTASTNLYKQHRFLEVRPPWTDSYLRRGRSSLRAEAVYLSRYDPVSRNHTKGQRWYLGHLATTISQTLHALVCLSRLAPGVHASAW